MPGLRRAQARPRVCLDAGGRGGSEPQPTTPPSEAEVTALLNGFLEARVAGNGVQQYLSVPEAEVPLLYASASPVAPGRTHVLSASSDDAVGITVTMPASGWSGEPGGWAMERGREGFSPPDGAAIIAFVVDEEFYVYGDRCHWSSTRPDIPATSVDETRSRPGEPAVAEPIGAVGHHSGWVRR